MTITLNHSVTVSDFEINPQNTRNEIMDFIMKLDLKVAKAIRLKPFGLGNILS